MNHNEAIKHIQATLTAFGPGEAVALTQETWANLHAAMTALIEQPEQEPVAWISEDENLLSLDKFYDHMKPLYTAPTPRKPLSEKEMYAVEEEARKNFRLSQRGPRGQQITYWDGLTPWLIRAVEAAHGIGEQHE